MFEYIQDFSYVLVLKCDAQGLNRCKKNLKQTFRRRGAVWNCAIICQRKQLSASDPRVSFAVFYFSRWSAEGKQS